MIRLNLEQQTAVESDGNVVVTACPGSGKTRVLTARVIRGLSELKSSRHRVVALTFTNRAADEIQVRLDQENVPADHLWAGTIHSFALEWILRPYAPYCDETRFGFAVADDFHTERVLARLKKEEGLSDFDTIKTTLRRNGAHLNEDETCAEVFAKYKAELRTDKLIDYDDVLFLAYRMLDENPEIAATLAAIIRLVCVDEVQDIQDLQFGILSKMHTATGAPPCLFFVGDADQSIYESLGALTKTPEEIAAEFGLKEITHRELTGNYRSTQRIIDFFRGFRPSVPTIMSRTSYAHSSGLVTFHNQAIAKEDLPETIARLVSDSLAAGVAPHDVCVLAPHWWQVRSLARNLVALLPSVDFDAPGLSPLHSSRDNFWFKVGRLLLTEPSPSRTRTRARWANEVLRELGALADITLPESVSTARRFLRIINGLSSGETEGMAYLQDAFLQLLTHLELDLGASEALKISFDTFFEKAQARITKAEGGMPTDVVSFRRLFSHPSGVVVSTCHGVKGEEYDTVIAFGLLRGYVPHWSIIINGTDREASERQSKLLYVICSRAKRRLHLIAESGRTTQRGNPYETATLLQQVRFGFDTINHNGMWTREPSGGQ